MLETKMITPLSFVSAVGWFFAISIDAYLASKTHPIKLMSITFLKTLVSKGRPLVERVGLGVPTPAHPKATLI
jgi:hypothetical protein